MPQRMTKHSVYLPEKLALQVRLYLEAHPEWTFSQLVRESLENELAFQKRSPKTRQGASE
jgi:hypothetical protein